MALTRNELKAVVKELLKEILAEGLGDVRQLAPRVSAPIQGSVRENKQLGSRRPAFDPRLDVPIGNGRRVTDSLKEAIVQEARGNPIMQDLLADTAMTTLPSQMTHGDSMGTQAGAHGPVQEEQFAGNPDEVFGSAAAMRPDGSSHWADLAFMAPDKKSA